MRVELNGCSVTQTPTLSKRWFVNRFQFNSKNKEMSPTAPWVRNCCQIFTRTCVKILASQPNKFWWDLLKIILDFQEGIFIGKERCEHICRNARTFKDCGRSCICLWWIGLTMNDQYHKDLILLIPVYMIVWMV